MASFSAISTPDKRARHSPDGCAARTTERSRRHRRRHRAAICPTTRYRRESPRSPRERGSTAESAGLHKQGVDEGARLITAACNRPRARKGYYVVPTIFSDVTNDMTIAQEEILDRAVHHSLRQRRRSDRHRERFQVRTCRRGVGIDGRESVRSCSQNTHGQVSINGGSFNVIAPFGGYRQSGIGASSASMASKSSSK